MATTTTPAERVRPNGVIDTEIVEAVRKEIKWETLNDTEKARLRKQADDELLRRLDTLERSNKLLQDQSEAMLNTANKMRNRAANNGNTINRIRKAYLIATHD